MAVLRTAVRGLVKSPTVTCSAIFCLAIGIGATTAISSALSRVLLQPLPFRDADRLVAVHRITPQSGPQGAWPESAPNYAELARDTRQVQQLSALTWAGSLVELSDQTVRASAVLVTSGTFSMLGARAQRGRLLIEDDGRDDAPPVVVLSDDFWRSKLGGDPAVIGRSIPIDGTRVTVVGVLPRDFRLPHGPRVVRGDLWRPLRFSSHQLEQRRSNFLFMLGRLAPGATVQSAQAEVRGLFGQLIASYPSLRGENLRVAPLRAENVASVRTPLLLVFGAVCMVLLIAATNVAALLLARGVQRRREMAVRVALGAARWDAMRPAMVESILITLAGVSAGLLLAMAGIRTIGTLAAARIPQLAGLSIDGRVVGFALLLALVVGLACGVVPAWRGASVSPQDALRGGRGGGSGREHHRALRALVVAEIGLSLMLLIGAGLVLRAFVSLMGKNPGFDPSRLLTMQITTSAQRYADRSSARFFLDPALAAIRAVPGVESAASINMIPYVGWGTNSNIQYEGMPGDDPTRLPLVEYRVASPGFFSVTKQRLLAGRLLSASDDDGAKTPQVVVVNQALVERDFKGRSPVGRRFVLGTSGRDTSFATIVGVVSDIRNAGPFAPPAPEMYWSYQQADAAASTFPLMIRVRGGEPGAVTPAVLAAIRSVDPTAAVDQVRPMTDVIAQSLGQPRFYLAMLGAFAAVALLLAVAGLCGVLSYAVAQRTREIGIRAALGSPKRALVGLVALEGLRLVAVGLAIGVAGAFALTRLMTFMLYGVSPLDAGAWVAACGVLAVVAIGASLVPAGRATRVNPLVAIQAE